MNTRNTRVEANCLGVMKHCGVGAKRHGLVALAFAIVLGAHLAIGPSAQSADVIYLDQGNEWTTLARADFYTRDQGSRLIPYAWLKALEHPDGQPFLADQLGRYGYLPNPGNPDGLPVGFTRNEQYAGMNCAACHTRQISVADTEYRVDGGPAIVDAQSLLSDINVAIGRVLASDANFRAFAKRVLGPPNGPPNPNPDDVVHLKEAVQAWHLRFDAQMSRGLPVKSWGPGRMDAVGMIFNRLTGLDIGPPPSFIIADNIRRADAPVRYPFLWNAAIQDKTQWPGFADNGSDILGLARNLGEVYGVFADYYPKKASLSVLGIDYLHNNSANFDGLRRLEDLIKMIDPPKYPWKIDKGLAAQGKLIYERPTVRGGCVDCHGIQPGKTRFFDNKTWATPLLDVGTDSREYNILNWTAKTGVLEGKHIPFLTERLKPTDRSFNILTVSVLGSIIQQKTRSILTDKLEQLTYSATDDGNAQAQQRVADARDKFKLPTVLQDLKGAFNDPLKPQASEQTAAVNAKTKYVYESRVLEGIWATAPYLHNGSVPTLADLLEPADKRPKKFKIGPNYDIDKLGLAREQTKFGNQTLISDPNDRNSGNSNCGHEYGTTLTPAEKKALLEYLKVL